MQDSTGITLGVDHAQRILYDAHINKGLVPSFTLEEFECVVDDQDLLGHMAVFGGSGTGKTSFISNIMIELIKGGHGLTFIDVHGDAAEDLLKHVPPHRVQDVIYFDAGGDRNFPVGLNLLADVPQEHRHVVASNIVSTLKAIWSDSWGPRMEDILYNTLVALMDVNASLLAIPRLYTDRKYRRRVAAQVQDGVIRNFWENEFEAYNERFKVEAVQPVLNKVRKLISNPILRNILSQRHSTFSTRKHLDDNRVLLCNFSKSNIGEEHANLLASLMTSHIIQTAMGRGDVKEGSRVPHYLFLDEWQNYDVTKIRQAFEEARKFKLAVIASCQHLAQTDDQTVASILSNVQSLVQFRLNPHDANKLSPKKHWNDAEQIFRDTSTTLSNMPNYRAVVSLPLGKNGRQVRQYIDVAPPLEYPRRSYAQSIINDTRTRFARRREDVERAIDKFLSYSRVPEYAPPRKNFPA